MNSVTKLGPVLKCDGHDFCCYVLSLVLEVHTEGMWLGP